MRFSLPLFTSVALGQVIYVNDADPINANIKQVVVLMLENRSFDTFLGRLKLDGLNPNVNGPELTNGNTLGNGTNVQLRYREPSLTNDTDPYDPLHEVPDVTGNDILTLEQIYGVFNGSVRGTKPTMQGFGTNVERNAGSENQTVDTGISEVFGLHGPESLPVTYALAQEFSVIDDWYASVPGPTYPNRHFLHCATAMGQLTNFAATIVGIDCKTLYSNLNDMWKSWRVYTANTIENISVLLYTDFRFPWNLARIRAFKSFDEDCKKGTLPAFSYIDPDFVNGDNHPPHNLYNGESFLKSIYESLRASPQWNSTLLIVTYDEHGGFYDHVTPPTSVPIPDNSAIKPASGDFKFDRLGVRVPTILISPWVPKGGVFRSGVAGRNFEHSSISATLKKFFNLKRFLTKRDAWAVSFHSVVNYLTSPRTDAFQTVPI
ncbi:hypothetical protein HDV01_003516 [Terramyces sp. JEL0728]|nr:hypothetical protein HDV01_003516 [Terramyces sp. JEL0728]